jgi:hypothetical protein
MEKPNKEKYGYVESTGFDSEQSGFVIEGGEEAYEEAMKRWQFMQDNGFSEDMVTTKPDVVAKLVLATDLLKWLNDERNILQNTGQMMWHRPNEQKDTLYMAECLDKTIKYIEKSKFLG